MPYLRIEEQQYPLLDGDTRVGRRDAADVPLPAGYSGDDVAVVITVAPDQSVTVRRTASGLPVLLNGVALGSEPALLFHGDRLDIADSVAIYGDEAHGGPTEQMPVATAEQAAAAVAVTGVGRRGRSNGRVVSLTDGREYAVLTGELSIGRDAACDLVIAAGEVSRRHARIELREDGYVLIDTSTNGILVNGHRIKGSHPLAQGDSIRIGPEELRFHADVEEVRAPTPAPVIIAVPPPPAAPAPVSKSAPPSPPLARAAPSAASAQPTEPPVSRTVLATLEIINEGPAKGTKFSLASALTHVGRGAHNDVVITDESVSDSHAKIQRRESGWYVVDMDSTNGTYVSGQRIQGEAPIDQGMDLRFGGVKLQFRTTASPKVSSGTRVIVGYQPPALKPGAAAPPSESRKEDVAPERQSVSPIFMLMIVVLLVVFLFIVFQWR